MPVGATKCSTLDGIATYTWARLVAYGAARPATCAAFWRSDLRRVGHARVLLRHPPQTLQTRSSQVRMHDTTLTSSSSWPGAPAERNVQTIMHRRPFHRSTRRRAARAQASCGPASMLLSLTSAESPSRAPPRRQLSARLPAFPRALLAFHPSTVSVAGAIRGRAYARLYPVDVVIAFAMLETGTPIYLRERRCLAVPRRRLRVLLLL
ncbi:hypothetical protein PYCCODRAFT_351098 [Trametes coccinea BRFM310]|uniref:Uncharacterized protein n=1 Tax=Trametes coccinea (strain BRFM310) TaxID=1353009 RepID=A0A1Y2J302_TRAC3|nr:hypothetical protein PYCCODRAFT_351098 [Trametes coccinea BRFM310]